MVESYWLSVIRDYNYRETGCVFRVKYKRVQRFRDLKSYGTLMQNVHNFL